MLSVPDINHGSDSIVPERTFPIPAGAPRGIPTDGGVARAAQCVIGESRAIRDALAKARRIGAEGGGAILITGEPGTGKALFARVVHESSANSRAPFLTFDCAAVPAALFEREMCGEAEGGYADLPGGERVAQQGLFDLAGDGTLLLNNVVALPLTAQRLLAQVLKRGTFRRIGGTQDLPLRVRLIATTDGALELCDDLVRDRTFGHDLHEALSQNRIDLPPLRDRGQDAELIARATLHEIGHAQGRNTPFIISGEAARSIRKHAWPGNVRELRSAIERAAAMCENGTILRRHLMFQRRRVTPEAGEITSVIHVPADGKPLDAIVREAIRITLILTQGNLSAAARTLGISRPTLARKMCDASFLSHDDAIAL